MDSILKAFDRYPSQKDVVRVMLQLGLSVRQIISESSLWPGIILNPKEVEEDRPSSV